LSEELDTLIQEGIVAVAVDGDQGISHNKLSDGEHTVQLIRNRVEALKPDLNPLIISNSSRGFIDGADVRNSMYDGSYGLVWLVQEYMTSLKN